MATQVTRGNTYVITSDPNASLDEIKVSRANAYAITSDPNASLDEIRVSRANVYAITSSPPPDGSVLLGRANAYAITSDPNVSLDEIRVSRANVYAITSVLADVLTQEDQASKPPYVTGTNPYLDVTGSYSYTLLNQAISSPGTIIYMEADGTVHEVLFDSLPEDYTVNGYQINQMVILNTQNLVVRRSIRNAMETARGTVTLLPPRP